MCVDAGRGGAGGRVTDSRMLVLSSEKTLHKMRKLQSQAGVFFRTL